MFKYIKKELEKLKEDKIDNVDFIKIGDNEVIISITCPVTYCCAGEIFEVRFLYEHYPHTAPKVFFIPPKIPKHRDVNEVDGSVHFSFLWEAKMRFRGLIAIVLDMLRSVRADFLNWKKPRGLKTIECVDQSYEIQNGLIGTQRSVLLSLFRIVGENTVVNGKLRDQSVRALMGLCAEHIVLKTHHRFVHTRMTLMLDVPLTLEGYICLPATVRVRRTDAVNTVGTDLEVKTGLDQSLFVFFKGETLLENTHSFLDYNFRNGVKLTVRPSPWFKNGPLSVTVVTLAGLRMKLRVDPRNTIESLMIRADRSSASLIIERRAKSESESENWELLRNESTLQESNIEDGAVLMMVCCG